TGPFGMLRELALQNLALIEDIRVELEPGFCAWTGETGAGKSLLLGAIGLLLGERGSAELIRAGRDDLRVTGRFELTRPEQRVAAEAILQDTLDTDELILTRRLTRTGRSSALVNERPVAVGTLRRLGEMLVDIHGQRESYSLLQPAYQLELLDAFGKLTHLRQNYLAIAEQVRELRRHYRSLIEQRQTRQRELTLIRFEQEELQAAQLRPDERDAIEAERLRLVHAQALAAFADSVSVRLHEAEGSVSSVLGRLLKEASRWSGVDPRLADVAQRLHQLKPEVQDLAETCRDLADGFEADPERLEELENRLQLLTRLESKYHRPLSELIAYRDSLANREAILQQAEDDLTSVESQLRQTVSSLRAVAEELSQGRAKVAKKLAAEVQKHLADLQMGQAQLDAVLEPIPLGDNPLSGDVPVDGMDHLELLLTANPGEPARPLRKVASGGELSRTTLALKTVLAAHDPVRTLVVFDEIDANVGGRLGDVLGEKLRALGASHQVLCITHLPQVASYATHHWTIRKQTTGKSTRGQRTTTTIKPLLTQTERVEELALMLRGEARSETTKREAAAMLRVAHAK
ncbi:MAG: DNA repair protein RecN, partial [Bacteroidales bacterium]|nr:DNA repair protein RecN [Bacteroidales bacterium]